MSGVLMICCSLETRTIHSLDLEAAVTLSATPRPRGRRTAEAAISTTASRIRRRRSSTERLSRGATAGSTPHLSDALSRHADATGSRGDSVTATTRSGVISCAGRTATMSGSAATQASAKPGQPPKSHSRGFRCAQFVDAEARRACRPACATHTATCGRLTPARVGETATGTWPSGPKRGCHSFSRTSSASFPSKRRRVLSCFMPFSAETHVARFSARLWSERSSGCSPGSPLWLSRLAPHQAPPTPHAPELGP